MQRNSQSLTLCYSFGRAYRENNLRIRLRLLSVILLELIPQSDDIFMCGTFSQKAREIDEVTFLVRQFRRDVLPSNNQGTHLSVIKLVHDPRSFSHGPLQKRVALPRLRSEGFLKLGLINHPLIYKECPQYSTIALAATLFLVEHISNISRTPKKRLNTCKVNLGNIGEQMQRSSY